MIIHYLASNPNFIPFFFMGFTVALGFSFWGSAKQGCLIGALYVYVFGVWFFTCLIFIFSYSSGQEFFIFGILAYHIKTVFSWISTAFFWMIEKNRQWKEAEDIAKWEKEQEERQKQQYHQKQSHQQSQYQQERARREQEARQYREQQERAKREQERQKSQQEKRQEPPSKKPEPARDTRTFEEILGISKGSTKEEAKKAYSRLCNFYHPDKLKGKPEALRKEMELEFKKIQEAYFGLYPKPKPEKDPLDF